MKSPVLEELPGAPGPESLLEALAEEPGVVLLRSAMLPGSAGPPPAHGRYSLLAARPFLSLRASGCRCELAWNDASGAPARTEIHFANPWALLDVLLARCELLDEIDLPFPLGGCFGYWGYDLKNFVEPKLRRRAANDLELPDCHVGFYDSLLVHDHALGKCWIVSTGLDADGSRSAARAQARAEFWRRLPEQSGRAVGAWSATAHRLGRRPVCEAGLPEIRSNLTREEFLRAVEQAQRYIRSGDIYQVNLSHRLQADCAVSGPALFERLLRSSPAPFAAFVDCGDFKLASSSPEQFLRISGAHILTRPIKGTRPRSLDPEQDAQLALELQTSPKELAELVMITDLLRNDLGRVCEFGSVQVPALAQLERFAQVQHLVSTVEGRLRPEVTHLAALAACFPGGSVTGAPKFRAMEIIDELEPVARGPYCGCHGYVGFNRESQLSITIRTALWRDYQAWFHAGAGIVADSIPEAEYAETLAKAAGFVAAIRDFQTVSSERL